ncbi:MGMT family protein [Arthrobacter sp. FW306-05-C]|uniref:MGMT family protein n=1 Tax=Arthrobacter TaxID=1663 RepID=UPI001EF0ABDB|nr:MULTISPECIES: MGMT family protein [Arthrobacter]MDP9985142.1 alkylated DNA nucleotide flippase Atl1 [Arthrobacter oryzae]UKA65516.1 MGMT family protein [Arthrobacter sp. FW306-05-C]UKA69883.1 MGMT family protein [Arthrobacter sp. FW306-06-A]UKA74182.1 MGMT family protein [Arthrobacter sp. FW306-07-I]
MRNEYVQAVLAVVRLVPAGSAVSYGDVAELLGSGGPRQVGSVMSHHGGGVPWWRVLKASGHAPEGHEAEALLLYLEEGTPLLGDYSLYLRSGEGRWRVDLAAARWAPTESDFDTIDEVAEALERRLHRLSVADDGMSL